MKIFKCKHDYKLKAEHETTQSHLWQCKKCKLYYVQHYGIDVGYTCKVPNIGGWVRVRM